MKYIIKHDIRGRIRIHVVQQRMTNEYADSLQYYLDSQSCVISAKVQERLGDVVIRYDGSREEILDMLKMFHIEKINVPAEYFQNSSREMNKIYWDKIVTHVVTRGIQNICFPVGLRNVIVACKSVKYLWHGVRTLAKRKLEVPVLDATAIGVSILRGDFKTAGSIMFLLGMGEFWKSGPIRKQ